MVLAGNRVYGILPAVEPREFVHSVEKLLGEENARVGVDIRRRFSYNHNNLLVNGFLLS